MSDQSDFSKGFPRRIPSNALVFTDAQLEREIAKTLGHPEMVEMWCVDFEALLARLEAAEEALVRLMYIPSEYRTSGMTRAVDKWMKSAGKY